MKRTITAAAVIALAAATQASANVACGPTGVTYTGWSPGTVVVETVSDASGVVKVTNRKLPRDSSYPLPPGLEGPVTVHVRNTYSTWTGEFDCGVLVPPVAPTPPVLTPPTVVVPDVPAPPPAEPPVVIVPVGSGCPATRLTGRIATRPAPFAGQISRVTVVFRNAGKASTRSRVVVRYRLPAGASFLRTPRNSRRVRGTLVVRAPRLNPGRRTVTRFVIRYGRRAGTVRHSARAGASCTVAATALKDAVLRPTGGIITPAVTG